MKRTERGKYYLKNKLFQKIKIICSILFVIFCILLAGCDGQKIPDNSTSDKINISEESSYPFYEVTSPIYTNLTLEHFKKLYVGMPFEDAIKIVGAPHKNEKQDYETGIVTKHYYTAANGREYILHYKNGTIDRIQYPTFHVTSPVKNDLNMSDIDKIYVGMPYEEVIGVLGAPHDYRGSGIVRDVYRLSDGGEVSIHYQWGSIDSFSKRDKNDVLIKIQ
jgi:hypothetical protein